MTPKNSTLSFVLLVLFLLSGTTHAQTATDSLEPGSSNLTVTIDQFAVQVLVKRKNKLIAQGSGVLIGDGYVATTTHLLSGGDQIVVSDWNGKEFSMSRVSERAVPDIAIIKGDGLGNGIQLAPAEPSTDEPVRILGYWYSALETQRKSLFKSSKEPSYVAKKVLGAPQSSKAILQTRDVSSSTHKYAASIGRGAYGSGVINRCGQLIGLVVPDETMDDDKQKKPHIPFGAFSVSLAALSEYLTEQVGSNINVSETSCSSVKQEIQRESTKESEQQIQAEKDRAKKAIDKAKKGEKEAEKTAQKEKERAEEQQDAREKAETDKEDIKTIVEDISSQVEMLGDENQTVKDDKERLQYIAAGVGTLALLLIAGLLFKRRRDLKVANDELKMAQQQFSDCRFEGTDSQGAPLAIVVLGRDLMQRSNGLVLGRNPEVANVVIADETVSREHAHLTVENDRLHITDLHSTGGTYLNGRRLEHDKTIMIDGDSIQFGDVRLSLTLEGSTGGE